MKVYLLVGVTTINYKDKKDGSPRRLTRLNCTYEDPTDKCLVGRGVWSEVVADRVFEASHYEPLVGDSIQLIYEPDFRGNARLAQIQPVPKSTKSA